MVGTEKEVFPPRAAAPSSNSSCGVYKRVEMSRDPDLTMPEEDRTPTSHNDLQNTELCPVKLTISILIEKGESFLEFSNLFFSKLISHGVYSKRIVKSNKDVSGNF